MKIKLSDYIADFLLRNNIRNIFTVTGGGAMHLNDAFGHKDGLKCVYNHHEQACAIAAESYTRLTNKLSAICVTSGPGGTNALTGVLGGWLDSIPMFIISGQVKTETTIWSTNIRLRQLGDQEFNIVNCVSTMTKYACMVTKPNNIKYHLEKALYLCKNGRGGPVWLDIPLDVQAAIIDTEKLNSFNPDELQKNENPCYDEKFTEIIFGKLKSSKYPVIFAGTGIRLGDAHKEFIELIEKLNIPVVTAWNAHDVLWNEHHLFCGRPGTIGTRAGNFIVQNSDLLIVLGCRLNIRQIGYNYRKFAKNSYKIVIDIDENELRKPTIQVDLPIHANVKDVLTSLNKYNYSYNKGQHLKWLNWCKNLNKKYPVVLKEYYNMQSPINPYVFINKLFIYLEDKDNIICGNGTACVVTFQAAIIKKGQRLYTNSGCASMGYGFPAAIGAAIASNGKRVICIDGDGSFQMNIQELQTVVYNKLNIKIFYLNNNGYHSIRQTQNNMFKSSLVGVCDGNGLSFPDAEKIANAYGISFIRINNLSDIDENIIKVLKSNEAVFCEVVLDSNQNFEPKISSKILSDGSITSPEIDDMYPFLSKEEYLSNKNID